MTKEIEWGPEIAVDGKRPEWLRDDDICATPTDSGEWQRSKANRDYARRIAWQHIRPGGFRLPADHPYYRATAAGFTYWPGGDAAPADRDISGEVLLRNGKRGGPNSWWVWSDVIGYHKRAWTPHKDYAGEDMPEGVFRDPPEPAGELARRVKHYDPATHVAVPLMTEAECVDNCNSYYADNATSAERDAWFGLAAVLGIIRPDPTPLERFMAAHPAADRETAEMVLAWKDGQ